MTSWHPSSAYLTTLLGCVLAILAFDVAGATVVRRWPSIRYANFWPMQFALYIVFGFAAMLTLLDLRLAATIGAITGLVEATLGWAITWRMGANRQPDATRLSLALAVASMVAFGYALALLGAVALVAVVWIVARQHG